MGTNVSTSLKGSAAFEAEVQHLQSIILDIQIEALKELDPKKRADLFRLCSRLNEQLEHLVLDQQKELTDDYSFFNQPGSVSRQNSFGEEDGGALGGLDLLGSAVVFLGGILGVASVLPGRICLSPDSTEDESKSFLKQVVRKQK